MHPAVLRAIAMVVAAAAPMQRRSRYVVRWPATRPARDARGPGGRRAEHGSRRLRGGEGRACDGSPATKRAARPPLPRRSRGATARRRWWRSGSLCAARRAGRRRARSARAKGRRRARALGRANGLLEQHHRGDGPDAARHRGDRPHHRPQRVEVDVADDPAAREVDPAVDDHAERLTISERMRPGTATGTTMTSARRVVAPGCASRGGRRALSRPRRQERGDGRPTTGERPTTTARRSGDRDLVGAQKLHHRGGGGGHEGVGVAARRRASSGAVAPSTSLVWLDERDHLVRDEVRWTGWGDDDPGHRRVAVQGADPRGEIGERDAVRRRDDDRFDPDPARGASDAVRVTGRRPAAAKWTIASSRRRSGRIGGTETRSPSSRHRREATARPSSRRAVMSVSARSSRFGHPARDGADDAAGRGARAWFCSASISVAASALGPDRRRGTAG